MSENYSLLLCVYIQLDESAFTTLRPSLSQGGVRADVFWCGAHLSYAGDISMYDVSDPDHPKLADRLWLGGSIAAGSGVTVAPESLAQLGLTEQPKRAVVKGVEVQGGPQMLQLR